MLVTVALTDELSSGVLPSGAPELLHGFDLSPAWAAGWTLFAVQILGAFLEAPLLAMAHGSRGRRMLVAGLATIGVACVLGAVAPSYGVLVTLLFLAGPMWGVGTGLAQASAVAARPDAREQALARWTLWGAVGDLLAPLALAGSVAAGFSWRGALAFAGALALAQAFAARTAPPPETEASEPSGSFWDALRSGRVVGWALATSACNFLDEILVAFGALHLDLHLGVTAFQRAAVLTAWTVGGIVGALILERVAAHFASWALMVVAAIGSAAAYLGWLQADGPAASAACLFAVGLFSSAHYPLLHARTYAAVPGRPELAAAVTSALSPVDASLPLIVAFVSAVGGLEAALWLLLAQAAVVLASGLVARRSEGTRRATT